MSAIDQLLAQRVVVCVGAGGVGKTTTAAALGLLAARRGVRAVVVTIDPARRLADALGLSSAPDPDSDCAAGETDGDSSGGGPAGGDEVGGDSTGGGTAGDSTGDTAAGSDPAGTPPGREPRRRLGRGKALDDQPRLVPGVGPGQLWGVMLDPQATFDRLVRQQSRSEEQARRILDNPIYRNLTTSLSGTHEYLAAEKLHELHTDDRFDLVIVDTPPARHALDVLDGPGRLIRFLDHRLYRSILSPRRGLLRAVNTATQSVLRTMSRLVGADLVDDVIAFFAAFEGLDQGFKQRAAEVNELLLGPDSGFVLVTSPRYQALRESEWLLDELARRDVAVAALVVNRATPDLGQPPDDDEVPPGLVAHLRAWRELDRMARAERQALATVVDQHRQLPTVVVEEQGRPVSDLAGLAGLAERLGEG